MTKMFKRYPKYTPGQELATKFWWSITQLAATAVHDIFILVYSSLPNTKNGSVSVSDYLEKAKKKHVLQELHDGGFDIANFKVSPKKAVFYDLQAIRKILDHVMAKPQHAEELNTFRQLVKKLVYLRNALSHHKMRSTSILQLMKDLEEVKDILWELYNLAAEVSGGTKADTDRAYHLLEQELDSLVSPASIAVCLGCSEELKSKRNEDTEEYGKMGEPGQNKDYQKTKENNNMEGYRTIKENGKAIENRADKGSANVVGRDSNDLNGINSIRTNERNGKTCLHIQHMIAAQEEGKEDARDRSSSSEEEVLSSSDTASSPEDSESDAPLQNREEGRDFPAVEAEESCSSDSGETRDECSRDEVQCNGDTFLLEPESKPDSQSGKETSCIFLTKIDQSNENCSNIFKGGISPDNGTEPAVLPIQLIVTQHENSREDTSSSSEEVPSLLKASCSYTLLGESQVDSFQQYKRDTLEIDTLGTLGVKAAGGSVGYGSDSGETIDSCSSEDEIFTLTQGNDTKPSNKDYVEADTPQGNEGNAPDTSCTATQTDVSYSSYVEDLLIPQNSNVDPICTRQDTTEHFEKNPPSSDPQHFIHPMKFFLIVILFSRVGCFFWILRLFEVMAAMFVVVYIGIQFVFLLATVVVVMDRHLHRSRAASLNMPVRGISRL